eukprot:447766-Rhodomonas_salina.1
MGAADPLGSLTARPTHARRHTDPHIKFECCLIRRHRTKAQMSSSPNTSPTSAPPLQSRSTP